MVDGDKLVNDLMGDTGTVIPLDVQFEIKSVVKNADGTLTITGTNGVVFKQPKTDNDVIITDRNGNQYAVSPAPQSLKLPPAPQSLMTLRSFKSS